jgi:hypothetical protein
LATGGRGAHARSVVAAQFRGGRYPNPAGARTGSLNPRRCNKGDLLPLAKRNLAIGQSRSQCLPLVILAVALLAIGLCPMEVEVGSFVAATVILLLHLISVREAYDAIDWPVTAMLGCLISVGRGAEGHWRRSPDGGRFDGVGRPSVRNDGGGTDPVVSTLVTHFITARPHRLAICHQKHYIYVVTLRLAIAAVHVG